MIDTPPDNAEIVARPGRDIVASMVEEFRRELRELVQRRPTALRLDLAGVGMIDSLGLGLLISAHNTLANQGGKLILDNVSQDLASLFRIMRLDQRMDVRPAQG